MEKRLLNVPERGEFAPEQVNFASMYRPGDVTIACSVRQEPDSSVQDENRGLVRKIANAILHLIGYRAHFDPHRNRKWD